MQVKAWIRRRVLNLRTKASRGLEYLRRLMTPFETLNPLLSDATSPDPGLQVLNITVAAFRGALDLAFAPSAEV